MMLMLFERERNVSDEFNCFDIKLPDKVTAQANRSFQLCGSRWEHDTSRDVMLPTVLATTFGLSEGEGS